MVQTGIAFRGWTAKCPFCCAVNLISDCTGTPQIINEKGEVTTNGETSCTHYLCVSHVSKENPNMIFRQGTREM
ncbi:hypothetical protein A6S26_05630 [Nostoc sp. ATCC 43529]|nr:hypothetical protein A6S26_05630 [Nostoc sp. ATCC 43529]